MVAHRARLLAAGEVNGQARQEFLRIAEKLEAEALAEVPAELQPISNSRTVIEGDPETHRAAGKAKGRGEVQEPQPKKRRGKKAG